MFHAQSMKISGLVQPYVMKFFPVHIDAKESAAHVENRHFMKNAKKFAKNVYRVVTSLMLYAVKRKRIFSVEQHVKIFLNVVMCAVELVVIVNKDGYTFHVSPSVVENYCVVTHATLSVSKAVLLVAKNVRCLAIIRNVGVNVETPV